MMKIEDKFHWKDKLMTAEEAVSLIREGDRVFIGLTNSVTPALTGALWKAGRNYRHVTILSALYLDSTPLYIEEDAQRIFKVMSPFLGANERRAKVMGKSVGYTSFHLSQVDQWFHHIGKATVAFLSVSAPNEKGQMSFGPSGGCMNRFALDTADRVILEVNPNVPFVYGQDAVITVEEADAIVWHEAPMIEIADQEPSEEVKQIAGFILPMIEDGSTIQLGIGGLSSAVGNLLTEKNDLGIFTEMLTNSMIKLIKNGNVTNKYKGFMNDKSVFAFAMGNQEMYDYMNQNEAFYSGRFNFVNDPRVIMKNHAMISVNTAMAVNLYGETAADAMGYEQYSAIGGQLDFVRGAQWSEGGKSVMAMESSFVKNGRRHSKINLTFPEGTPVTTPRSDIQYFVTEYGCVNLKNLTVSDRARAIISLAHPDFRDELTDKAKSVHLI